LSDKLSVNTPAAKQVAEKVAQALVAVRFSRLSGFGVAINRQKRTSMSACATKTFAESIFPDLKNGPP
jgi:hypothetical protein